MARRDRIGEAALALVCLLLLVAALRAQELPQAPQPAEPPKPIVPAAPMAQPAPPSAAPHNATELEHEVRDAIRTQPPCAPDVQPCALTPQQKFNIFVRRSYSPYTFVSAAFDSAYSQLTDEKYGPGMEGYGKYYGTTLAGGEFRSFFQTFVFSSILHQDPRFHRLKDGNAFYRVAYAATRVFVGRTDSGHSTFNTPEMLGSLTTSAFCNVYEPQHDRGLGETFSRAGSGLIDDAGTMLLQEFWPDIRGWFHRHEPDSVKKMEERIDKRAAPVPEPPRNDE